MMVKKKYNKPKRVRGKTLTLRVTEVELERINRKAESSLSREQYLRKMALTGKVIIPAPSVDREALMELNRIGNNINQITKKINESDVNVFSRAIKERLLREIKPLEELLHDKVMNLYTKIYK